jgi:hypothetical protein
MPKPGQLIRSALGVSSALQYLLSPRNKNGDADSDNRQHKAKD